MNRTLVIAEPGGTHQGDCDCLRELIRVAAECGADCFKPQWVSSADAHLQRRTKRLTQVEREAFYAKYAKAYGWLQFPVAWHADFAERCHNLGMEYAVSVCLPQDVWMIEPWVDRYKISSFEAGDGRLDMTARATGRPVVISNGMSEVSGSYWIPNRILCTSAYPTPLEQANLLSIKSHGFGGYSDHTRSLIAGALAVAYGAQIVEAHYRLDSCDPQNPDYVVAFSPAEFRQYIQYIRDSEMMRGDGVKKIEPAEAAMLPYKVSA